MEPRDFRPCPFLGLDSQVAGGRRPRPYGEAQSNPIQSTPHRIGLDFPWAPSASGEAIGKTSVYRNTFRPFSVAKYCFWSSDRKPWSTSLFRYLSACCREDPVAAATSEFACRSRSWMTFRTRTILFLKAGVEPAVLCRLPSLPSSSSSPSLSASSAHRGAN